MNYPALRWVDSPDCKVTGSARAVLWAIAFHANRDTGECWLGQRRLAQASGLARSTVQLALDQLFGQGVLEAIEDSRGRLPERYQIAPGLVEGEASATGVIEAAGGGSGLVEGTSEVIHSPAASGPTVGPQGIHGNFLVDRSSDACGPIRGPQAEFVDRSGELCGPTTSALTSGNGSQGFKHGSELQVKNHVLDNADSTADAVGVVEASAATTPDASELARTWEAAVLECDPGAEYQPSAWLADLSHRQPDGWMLSNGHFLPASVAPGWVEHRRPPPEPPPVDEATKEHLRRRGLGQRQPPPTVRRVYTADAPSMDRARQLAELERRYPEAFAEQERQEREGSIPHVQDLAHGVEAHAGAAHGEQRTDGRTTGHRVDVGQIIEVELADPVTIRDDGHAADRLRVVNE